MFIVAAVRVCRDGTLEFVETPAMQPPEVVYDAERAKKAEADLAAAAAAPLPDLDDTDDI